MLKTREQCIKEYGSDYLINQKIAKGELYRIDRRVLSDDINVPEVALLSFKYQNAVITLETALYIYGLSDEIPDYCYMATKRESAPIIDKRIKQIFVPKNILDLGKVEHMYKGYKIFIYSKERLLIELIRYKNKLPFNYYKENIRNYRKILPQLNIELINQYAEAVPKSDRIINILRMEVF